MRQRIDHNNETPSLSRRALLSQVGQGFGSLALAGWLQQASATPAVAGITQPGAGSAMPSLHYPARAKRVIQLFMAGAASHLDLWDYKPALEKSHGKPSDFGEHVEAFQNGLGPWMKTPFRFRPYGESGK